MPFGICEVLSADGKPLRGSVMNKLFKLICTSREKGYHHAKGHAFGERPSQKRDHVYASRWRIEERQQTQKPQSDNQEVNN